VAIIPPEERVRLGFTKHVPAKRTCLRCGKKFNSAWIDDRMPVLWVGRQRSAATSKTD
jgi:hypothetical protein